MPPVANCEACGAPMEKTVEAKSLSVLVRRSQARKNTKEVSDKTDAAMESALTMAGMAPMVGFACTDKKSVEGQV